MKKIIIILAIIIFVTGAYFDYSIWSKPSIGLIKISSTSVVSMKDTLAIYLKFEDRDGDVGDSIMSLSKVYAEDSQYHVVQEFPILTAATIYSFRPVTGSLRVLINLLPLLDTSMQRTTKLKVYITDRKGHKSNMIETPEIHISRPEF